MTDVELFKQQHLTIPCMLPRVDMKTPLFVSEATCRSMRERTKVFNICRSHINTTETIECPKSCPHHKPVKIDNQMVKRHLVPARTRDLKRDALIVKLARQGFTRMEIYRHLINETEFVISPSGVASTMHRHQVTRLKYWNGQTEHAQNRGYHAE